MRAVRKNKEQAMPEVQTKEMDGLLVRWMKKMQRLPEAQMKRINDSWKDR